MRWRLFVALLVASCGGGSDDAPTPPANVHCSAREIADASGRCAPVGVDACADGFVADGTGGCDAILPKEDCAGASMAIPGDATCVPVGVPACAAGFATDGKGGCSAVLRDDCGEYDVAALGEATCHPLGTCGAAPYGDVPTDLPVVHVDASFAGASDGSASSPFRTIQAAIDATTTKSTIAIAAGTYVEDLDVGKPLRLFGRCPSLVTIRGVDGVKAPTVRVHADLELANLSITAPMTAAASVVQIADADARLERVRIHHANAIGLRVQRSTKATKATVRDVVVDHTLGIGVWIKGASLDGERLFVRDVALDTDGVGRGIEASSIDAATRGELSLRASVVERTVEAGIVVGSASAAIESTLVRGIAGDPTTFKGIGISAETVADLGASQVSIDSVVVEGTHGAGVLSSGSKLVAKNLTVREGRALSDAVLGPGNCVSAYSLDMPKLVADLDLSASKIEGCDDAGVHVVGATARLDSVLVVGAKGKGRGEGMHFRPSPDGRSPSVVTAHRVLVSGTDGVGAFALGSTVTLDSCELRDVHATVDDLGDGLIAQPYSATRPVDLRLLRAHVHGTEAVGLRLPGAKATIDASVVRVIAPRRGRFGRGVELEADDLLGVAGELRLSSSVIADTNEIGLVVSGSHAHVEQTTIRRVKPTAADGFFAAGVVVQTGAKTEGAIELVRSLVEETQAVSVYAIGASATLEGCLVRATHAADGKFGDALSGRGFEGKIASLDVRASLLRDGARAAVSLFGAHLVVAGSQLSCNAFDLDRESLEELTSTLEDGGGNVCGCAAAAPCKAQSASLSMIPFRP